MRPHLSIEMALSLPPLHLSTFALGVLLARWQTLRNDRRDKAPIRPWQVNLVLARWLSGRWLVALGNSSYALYLIHTPILTLFLHFQWVAQMFYPVYVTVCV